MTSPAAPPVRGSAFGLCLLALAGLGIAPSLAQETPEPTPAPEKARDPHAPLEFESYQLVLLRSGKNTTKLEPADARAIQSQHLGHIKAMIDAGKMVVAGPFSDQKDQTLRGLCLYRVESLEAARKLAEADPAVAAGRLRVEVMTWWTEKGRVTFPLAPKLEEKADEAATATDSEPAEDE